MQWSPPIREPSRNPRTSIDKVTRDVRCSCKNGNVESRTPNVVSIVQINNSFLEGFLDGSPIVRCDGGEELLCGLDIDLLAPLADVDWVEAT